MTPQEDRKQVRQQVRESTKSQIVDGSTHASGTLVTRARRVRVRTPRVLLDARILSPLSSTYS
jgi:hypothetical protein